MTALDDSRKLAWENASFALYAIFGDDLTFPEAAKLLGIRETELQDLLIGGRLDSAWYYGQGRIVWTSMAAFLRKNILLESMIDSGEIE